MQGIFPHLPPALATAAAWWVVTQAGHSAPTPGGAPPPGAPAAPIGAVEQQQEEEEEEGERRSTPAVPMFMLPPQLYALHQRPWVVGKVQEYVRVAMQVRAPLCCMGWVAGGGGRGTGTRAGCCLGVDSGGWREGRGAVECVGWEVAPAPFVQMEVQGRSVWGGREVQELVQAVLMWI